MMQGLYLIVAGTLLLGSAAGAQSLKLKEPFASDRAKVAKEAKEASDACGKPISFQVDFAT